MGNEQQGGSSHHFLVDTSNEENKKQERHESLWTKSGRIPVSKQTPTSTIPSWQKARDITMDILSRKATKLSLAPGATPNLSRSRSITKRSSFYGTPTVPKSPQLYRTPRMPTEKEAAEAAIAYESLCSFCDGPRIGDYLRCRVCIKVYHSRCLFERGHVSDETFSLPRLAKQDWSCPECRDLTRLLNHDELNYLIQAFEQIDRNKDGYIILEEYLSLQSNKKLADGFELFIQHNPDLGKFCFSLMDSTRKGVVAWSDFVLFYSCKLIVTKNKIELATKLTKKELVTVKSLFLKDPRKTFDNTCNIIITRDHFNKVYSDLIVLLKKKYGEDFIDEILGYDRDNDKTSEESSMMKWEEFVREISVLILLNRFNDDITSSQPRRAAIPTHLSKATVVVPHSNVPPIAIKSTSRLTFSRSNTPGTVTLQDISCDESFRKHARILEKLNQRNLEEELKRKEIGSSTNCVIVENLEEENNINLPKLKPNARDDRKAITDPWTSVNEMQQLRNEPILVKTTRIRMLKT